MSKIEPGAPKSLGPPPRILLKPFFANLFPTSLITLTRGTDIRRDSCVTAGVEDIVVGLCGKWLVVGRLSTELASGKDVGAERSSAH